MDDFLHSSVGNRPEKKNRSKLFGILLLVGAVIIIGLMWFRLGSGPAPLEVYSLNDLSIEEVSEYLELYPAGIFINDSELGIRDTISSLTEFLNLIPEAEEFSAKGEDPFNTNLSLDTLTLVEEGNPGFADASQEANDTELLVDNTVQESEILPRPDAFVSNPSPAPKREVEQKPRVSTPEREVRPSTTQAKQALPFKTYEVEISGERKQGVPLTFSIKDFNSRVSYFMDYGNGVTQRVKLRHAFSYEEPGSYDLKLIAIDQKSGRKSSYTENIVILPGEEVSQEEEPVVGMEVDTEQVVPDKMASPPTPGPSATVIDESEDPLSDRGILEGGEQAIDEASSEVVEEESAPVDLNAPLKIVEVLPSFPGGLAALNKFVQREQQYPSIARENGIKGKVYLQFTVTELGKLENVKVLRGIGYGCDEEALRLVSIMPDWIPGRHSNRVVPVLFTLPITFRLN